MAEDSSDTPADFRGAQFVLHPDEYHYVEVLSLGFQVDLGPLPASDNLDKVKYCPRGVNEDGSAGVCEGIKDDRYAYRCVAPNYERCPLNRELVADAGLADKVAGVSG